MNWNQTIISSSVAALLCFSCTPSENMNGIPAADEFTAGQPSLNRSYPCGSPEYFSFSETNGNQYVDDCGLVPCASNTIPWGEVSLETSNDMGNLYLEIEGEATSSWTFTDYDIFASDMGGPNLDANGMPIVDGDWIQREMNGSGQSFNEVIPIQPASLSPYQVSVRVSLYRLDFFGGYDATTFRNLWIAYRPNTVNSRTQYVVQYTPPSCTSTGNRLAFAQ